MAEPAAPTTPLAGALVVATPAPALTPRERLAHFKILEEKRHELIEVRRYMTDVGYV